MPGVAFSLRALRRPQFLRCPQAFGVNSRRWLHERKPLDYLIEKGLGDFMPPEALRTIAVDYQQGLLTRLNEEVKGREEEAMTVADTVINSAMDGSKILAFNYASQALNNHFFLENLKTPSLVDSNSDSEPRLKPNNQDEISPNLIREIRGAHGSLAQLKSTFSAAAMGMFSSGWVWFVTDTLGNTAVVPTFGTGSLLVRAQSYIAHTEGQSLKDIMFFGRGNDMPLEQKPATEQEKQESVNDLDLEDHPLAFRAPGTTPASPASGVAGRLSGQSVKPRFMHTSSVNRVEDFSAPTSPYDEAMEDDEPLEPQTLYPAHGPDANKLGQVLLPLFCVSVHEHAWLSAGYGVWGKEEYLKRFWNVVDWEKVSKSYDWYVADARANKSKYT